MRPPLEAPTVNVAVVRGALSGVPELRVLESGQRLATLAIRTHGADARATSVPVTVWDPPALIAELDEGDEVVVVGAVRRRFFGSVSGTRSRTEVEATYLARPTPGRLAVAMRRAADALGGLA